VQGGLRFDVEFGIGEFVNLGTAPPTGARMAMGSFAIGLHPVERDFGSWHATTK
jgi:hypothetical protein